MVSLFIKIYKFCCTRNLIIYIYIYIYIQRNQNIYTDQRFSWIIRSNRTFKDTNLESDKITSTYQNNLPFKKNSSDLTYPCKISLRRCKSEIIWRSLHFNIYIYIYIYISSCRAASTDIPDPLSPPLPIVYRFWQVFRATSRILT